MPPSGAASSTRIGDVGRLLAVDDEAVRPRADPDVRDVPQPRRRLPPHAEGVGDVLAVRPRLHDPRGERRRRAHRRPVPGHPQRRVQPAEHREQPGPGVVEPGQHVGAATGRGAPRPPRRDPGSPARPRTPPAAAPSARRPRRTSARWVTWSSTDQPAAGVGRRQPSSSSGTTSARNTADSAARSSASAVIDTGTFIPPITSRARDPGATSGEATSAPARWAGRAADPVAGTAPSAQVGREPGAESARWA